MQVFMICRVHNPFGICGEKKNKHGRKKLLEQIRKRLLLNH